MKALLIALLVLTACGKAPELPIDPSAASAPSAQAQPQVVVNDPDPTPAPEVEPEPTFKVTFKFQYITGATYSGPRSTFVGYTYSECDQVRYMTDAEMDTLQVDYNVSGCSLSAEIRSESFIMNCNMADRTTLPYTNQSFCEWAVPYGTVSQ